MDPQFTSDIFSQWLMQYGSLALFFLLALGIVALPVPEETLMLISGTLIVKGKMPAVPTIAAAFFGALCGITMSYIIGKTAGHYLVYKYGKWVGLNRKRIERGHQWFERYGKWTLVIGYFIPCVRHLTGVCAGASEFSYRQFASYAYFGAALWVSTFISIGYFFGSQALAVYDKIELKLDFILFAAGALIIGALIYLFFRMRKRR